MGTAKMGTAKMGTAKMGTVPRDVGVRDKDKWMKWRLVKDSVMLITE